MKKQIISIFLTVCMVLCLVPTGVFAEETGNVAINETNFPDANFRSVVSGVNYDKNQDGVLSAEEIAKIKTIYCPDKEIESLQGIKFFTAIESLYCSENDLTALDVSRNTALEELYCWNNSLTSLNIGSNAVLKVLECYNNNLTSLNVSSNTALEFLSCYNNSLTKLDVSNNTALVTLYCGENRLTDLNVSNNTALETLSFFLNSLTDVDVSKNTELVTLNCGCNSLTALNISNNTKLERLWCQENNLTALDVSNNTALKGLCWWENNLTSLDITGISGLGGYGGVEASDNIYNIRTAVGTGRTFDLSTLPGNFDVSKASNWNGGTVDGTTLTIDEGVYTVTYTYDCGERKSYTFSLTTLQEITSIEATVTPPVNGEKPADSATCVTAPGNAAVFRSLSWDKIAEEDYTGQYWFDTWTPMEENETFQDGYYYRVKLYFDAVEGFGFFKNVIGTVNGRDHDDIYHDVYDYADSSYAYLCTVYTQLHTHEAGDEYAHDENSHWKECTECGAALTEKVAHTPDHEGHATEEYAIKCTVCGYEIEAQLVHTHRLTPVSAVAATCTTDGNKAYYVCTCGKWFEDATGSVEITAAETVVEATGHDYQWVIDKEATATEAGSKHEECTVCHDKKAAVEIPATGTGTGTGTGDGTGSGTGSDVQSPQTGDNSMMGLWFALLFVSGAGVVGTTVYSRKKKYSAR